jgi:hypothetical protein
MVFMNRLIVSIVALVCAGSGAFSQVDLDGTIVQKDQIVVYLFIGHSNMAGRTLEADRQTDPHLWNYKIDSEPNQWMLAKPPIHWDKDLQKGGGPGMPFLKQILEKYPDFYFGIIQNADGSNNMHTAYQPGNEYYDEIVDAAKKWIGKVTFGGVLTMLGASGTERKDSRAKEYASYAKTMIKAMRADLQTPDLPLLVGDYEREASGQYAPDKYYAPDIIAQIQTIPSLIPYSGIIATDGCEMQDDHHFSYEGHTLWAQRAVNLIVENDWFPIKTIAVHTLSPAPLHSVKTGNYTLYTGGIATAYEGVLFSLTGRHVSTSVQKNGISHGAHILSVVNNRSTSVSR